MNELLIAAWRVAAGLTKPSTYAPLLMKGPPIHVREQQWRDTFARNETGWFCLVVENASGELVAFAKANRSDHPDFSGELNKIYVRRDYQGLGIGRRLIGRDLGALASLPD